MVAAVVADGYDEAVVSHCLDIFGPATPPAGGAWTLDARAVCVARARGLFSSSSRWRLDDFMAAWRNGAPEARPLRYIEGCSRL